MSVGSYDRVGELSMKTVKYLAAVAAVASVMGLAGSTPAYAHKGHDHLLMGTLTMVAPDHVMVKVTDPKTKQDSVKTVVVTPATKILRGMPGTPAKAADLTTGSRIVVNIGEGKEPFSAKEIHFAVSPTPGTK
jgi:hypothetical protein